jgi:hypothetical protein
MGKRRMRRRLSSLTFLGITGEVYHFLCFFLFFLLASLNPPFVRVIPIYLVTYVECLCGKLSMPCKICSLFLK